MRLKHIFIFALAAAICFGEPKIVIKYAYNDPQLAENAAKAAESLKNGGIHLGLIENADIFQGEAGLIALKMGYIELLAANAKTLQYLIPSIWIKLAAAKNNDDSALREDLAGMGFSLIKTRFYRDKTIVIISRNGSAVPAAARKLLSSLL